MHDCSFITLAITFYFNSFAPCATAQSIFLLYFIGHNGGSFCALLQKSKYVPSIIYYHEIDPSVGVADNILKPAQQSVNTVFIVCLDNKT